MADAAVEQDTRPRFAEWPTVQVAPANGLELAYETFGDPSDPAILLVMGLGTQMLAWPEAMCTALAGAGHFVIRFDNRDVGLSTFIDAPVPSIADILLKRNTAYQVNDMASDALALVDHLGIDRFHLAGTSMGGFISQTMAIRAPERVLTLSLSMTSTGSRRVGRPTPAVIKMMAAAAEPGGRAEAIEESVSVNKLIGSPGGTHDDQIRELSGIAWDRNHDGSGRMRQLAAIMAQPNRTEALRRLRVPTTVVHGLSDPLVSATGGLALAKAIPGATFIGHHGMGHDLPLSMCSELTADMLALIERSGS
ncbi:alpha/beta fold hydrolase [Aquihabitans sp. McL0605]|uniref:alpha/beta fold hydrolase n=1 Tax=Aquihabitans sp. McL0605 TaxID=3415671 RepID=UPI003CEFDABC